MQQPSLSGSEVSSGQQEDTDKVLVLVLELTSPEQRESALLELSKRRETYVNLAPILWHSFGTISALLQEIIAIYPMLSPPTLTAQSSNRVCNALALLQCIASHPETRTLFLNAHLPLFLYPFLNTVSKTRPFEYLRLTSLGVVGALVKVPSSSPLPPSARTHPHHPPPASASPPITRPPSPSSLAGLRSTTRT